MKRIGWTAALVLMVLALFTSSPALGQIQPNEWPLSLSEMYSHSNGGYGYDDYEWTISASRTNPYINVGVPPASQPFTLYLWMTCTQNFLWEWTAAEMRIEDQATNVTLSGFTPLNGITSIGTFPDVLVTESGCPIGPFLVGAIECVSTGLAGGQLCIVKSQQDDLRATVDCSPTPQLWSMKTTGFGFGVAATCSDPDVFCDSGDVGDGCCLPDGSCLTLSSGSCRSLGGVSLGEDSWCEPTACCLPDGTCIEVVDSPDCGVCAAMGGVSRGFLSTCETAACKPSALEAGSWGRTKAQYR